MKRLIIVLALTVSTSLLAGPGIKRQVQQQQQQLVQQQQPEQSQQQQLQSNEYIVQILDVDGSIALEMSCIADDDECVDVEVMKKQQQGGWVSNPIPLNWRQVQELEGRPIRLKLKSRDTQYNYDRSKYEFID